jgi:hypothetical protein
VNAHEGTAVRRPLPGIVDEARELIRAADVEGLTLRALGGVAVRLLAAPGEWRLARELKDIDVVGRPDEARRVQSLLERMGYVGDREFNALQAGRRALYYDLANERRLDVFLGDFEMCHRIPLLARLAAQPATLPLAELLMTKLQVVQLNERDVVDVVALLLDHDVGDGDRGTVNAERIAVLCAQDWGLWRTTQLNVERVTDALSARDFGLTAEERARVAQRLRALWDRVQAEPKPARWRMRARVGDRRRWYELPEETG